MTPCCDCHTAESMIADMLTENTGWHFMDSGGDSGRVWQQHEAGMEAEHKTAREYLEAQPFVTWDDGGDGITVSTYHHLSNVLEVTETSKELDTEFHALAENSDDAWLATMDEFVDSLVADGRVEKRDVQEFNTYNRSEPVTQHIQGVSFSVDDQWYHLIHTHNGADIRGGYATPHVFAEKPSDIEGWAVQGVGEGVEIYCPNDGCTDDYGDHHRWDHQQEGIIFYGDAELSLYDTPKVSTEDGERPACPHCGTALEFTISRY